MISPTSPIKFFKKFNLQPPNMKPLKSQKKKSTPVLSKAKDDLKRGSPL